MTRFASAVFLPALLSASTLAAQNICSFSSSLDIPFSSTCSSLNGSRSAEVHYPANSVASFQLLFESSDEESVSIDVSSIPFSVSVSQLAYVFANETTRYEPSGGGWLPDPLLPSSENVTDGVYRFPFDNEAGSWAGMVSISIPAETPAGTYLYSVTVDSQYDTQILPVSITVYGFSLPPISDSSWDTIFVASNSADVKTSYDPNSLNALYQADGSSYTNALKQDYYDLLTNHRLPPDDLYLSQPRPIEDYEYLAKTGQRWFGLMDVSGREGGDGCNDFDETYISSVIADLADIVEQLEARKLLKYGYVYGFDECSHTCEPGVRKLFGAIKEAYPGLKTAAVLNWPGETGEPLPLDLPLDAWCLQYQLHDDSFADAWTAQADKAYWLYHCIEPSGSEYLNSFIERDLVQTRLLMWYGAARQAVTGWLYYAVDLFDTGCSANEDNHKIVDRLSESSCKIDFNPGNCVWANDPSVGDIWANGDGQFIYPGHSGPIGSTRLTNFLEGLQDVEIFNMLPFDDAKNLIGKIVKSATEFDSDVNAVESVRREAMALVEAAAETKTQ